MYAVIETGGKQYRVQNGDQLRVEKLNVKDGDTIIIDKVLAAGEGADIKIGTPYIDGFTVEAKAIESGKGEKVIIFKYKAKKDYRKKQGHRQPYTLIEITAIGDEKAPVKEDKPADEATDDAKAKADANEEKKPSKSLRSMKKAELIEYAKENGIEIDEKATNAVMIETIEAAQK